MLFYYPMIVHQEEGYWAEFPDLEGCNAWGDTFPELLQDAQGALSTHIYSILADQEKLNPPTDPDQLKTDSDSFITIVTVDINLNKEKKSVKKTLTIPYRMNQEAEKAGINFSQTLQEALISKLI